MKQVQLKNALHYKTVFNGVFDLAGEYKSGGARNRDGCVWIYKNGKKTRLQVNAKDVKVLGSKVDLIPEADISENIAKRFTVMETLVNGVISKSIKSMVISGAPGIGKTFTVDRMLKAADDAGKVKFTKLTGSATAIGLFLALWEHREEKDVLVLDDLDAIFQDQEALNLLKGALDTGRTRTISWLSASKFLHENDIPNTFEFKGTIIFISNLDFDGQIEKGSKLSPHLGALVNRCVYLDLGIHTTREVLIRIRQVIDNTNIMDTLGVGKKHNDDIIDWLEDNSDNLRNVSIRTILQLADFIKTSPKSWRDIAEITLRKRY